MSVWIIALYTVVNLATVRFVVDGNSMAPTVAHGDYLVISRVHYLLGQPQRGDVAVFHYPKNPQRDYIKRVIGLPGETVELRDQMIYINGERLLEPYLPEPCSQTRCGAGVWQLSKDEYFLMGDNRNLSSDSRAFGPVQQQYLIGAAVLRYYPLSDIAWTHQIGFPE